MPVALPAQIFATLHSFDYTDGQEPFAALVQATNGDLYGTALVGGANLGYGYGSGTVFKITPSGTLTTLYNFCPQGLPCADGISPYGRLVQAPNGDLYGTTWNASGNIFKITPSGTLAPLYEFCSHFVGGLCTDGENPQAGLVRASDGDFYGTTFYGGVNGVYPGGGTVFKITPSGTLTTLYSFCSQSGCTDGENPASTLVQATNGIFYGTTSGGGACMRGCGTIFKVTQSGTLTTLHSFCAQSGCPDGGVPGALIQATDGAFYGTTENGGANGQGTVFKVTPSGKLTTLHSFCSQGAYPDCTDGYYPSQALIQATDGAFYGTTENGGANGKGTVFKVTPSGKLTTLYSFCSQSGCPDGSIPISLVQDTNGIFYGTTYAGGANDDGTVFSLSVDLGPFLETQTASGAVGATVKILGTGLTGATDVTFNGTSAVFTAEASYITATVPSGATTGTVQVVTPVGTLSSNVPFRVP
jgi:uncharacterized repeat protein (TIGR03803 family)